MGSEVLGSGVDAPGPAHAAGPAAHAWAMAAAKAAVRVPAVDAEADAWTVRGAADAERRAPHGAPAGEPVPGPADLDVPARPARTRPARSRSRSRGGRGLVHRLPAGPADLARRP